MSYILTTGSYLLRNATDKILVNNNGVRYFAVAYIGGFAGITSIAFDPNVANNRFFVGTITGIAEVNATTLTIVRVINVEGKRFIGLTVDPVLPKIYVTARDGLWILDISLTVPTVNKVYNNPIGTGVDSTYQLGTLVVDKDLSRNRLMFTQNNFIRVMKRDDFTVTASHQFSNNGDAGSLSGLDFDPNPTNNRFLVVCRNDKKIKLVSGSTFGVLNSADTPTTNLPLSVLFDVLNQGLTYFLGMDNRLSIGNTSGLEEVNSLTVTGGRTQSVTLDMLNSDRYYVADYPNNRIIVIQKSIA